MRPQGLNDLHAYNTDRGAKVRGLKLLEYETEGTRV